MTQSPFNDCWLLEEIPACPVGMALLKAWADATPYGLELLLGNSLETLGDFPGSATAEWDRFVEHYGGCENCNETASPWPRIIQ